MKKGFMVALAALLMLGVVYHGALAQTQPAPAPAPTAPEGEPAAPPVPAPVGVDVEITGTVMGFAGTFAKEQAASLPAPYGDLNALVITSVKDIAANAEQADLKGQWVFFVPVQTALPLIANKAAQGKTVKVVGKLFKAERALSVESFEMQGGEAWDSLPIGNHSQVQVL